MDKNALFLRGKNDCFRLLKVRPRSQYELSQRLKQRHYPAQLIRQLIAYCKRLDLLNDERFARDWIQARMQKHVGQRRIRWELCQKGIPSKLIERQLSTGRPHQDEECSIAALIQCRQKHLRHVPETLRRQRLYGYLLRRGFDQDMVVKLLNQTFHDYDRD